MVEGEPLQRLVGVEPLPHEAREEPLPHVVEGEPLQRVAGVELLPHKARVEPLLRIVRGEPDDAELAALTAVVLSLASAPTPNSEPAPRSRWADRAALVRQPLPFGPGAWRASGLPR
jgi:hypothetical protein